MADVAPVPATILAIKKKNALKLGSYSDLWLEYCLWPCQVALQGWTLNFLLHQVYTIADNFCAIKSAAQSIFHAHPLCPTTSSARVKRTTSWKPPCPRSMKYQFDSRQGTRLPGPGWGGLARAAATAATAAVTAAPHTAALGGVIQQLSWVGLIPQILCRI